MNEELVESLSSHPDYQVLKRIQESFNAVTPTADKLFQAAIIDLETMGLSPASDEIIEIGLLAFSFSNEDGILSVEHSYNELCDPGRPIPQEVTKITGITNEDVKGKEIDWPHVLEIIHSSHLVICHNSRFDRNFLEKQTPSTVQEAIKTKPFACTIQDIDWKERGYESAKLDYLNWKLGFFYDGHRALTDCWATLNLLLKEQGAFDELKQNVRKKEVLICANNAPFDKKDLLKERNYRWSDGSKNLPKCWWTCIPSHSLAEEKNWLDEVIYQSQGRSDSIPQVEITAHKRYSSRAEII